MSFQQDIWSAEGNLTGEANWFAGAPNAELILEKVSSYLHNINNHYVQIHANESSKRVPSEVPNVRWGNSAKTK